MPEVLYHFRFRNPGQLRKFFIVLLLFPVAVGLGVVLFLYIFAKPATPLGDVLWALTIALPVGVILAALLTLNEKAKGADVPEDEFILYDNGWFVFWNIAPDEGWLAPAKTDWIYPEGVELRPLGIKKSRMYLLKKKRNGMYKVGFGLDWAYPNEKWENWVFHGSAGGWLTEEEYRKFLEMIDYLNKKGRENLESGRIKIPERNLKQEHIGYYQMPWFWNEVFKKENTRELYMRDTGEDIPEPIRSFLYDYPKFKKVYLKNKRETGDWFGGGD